MRILVTGGAGFLGSHLCEKLLAQGHEVIALDNYFTGSRQNIVHLLANERFEAFRHDVNQPITLEVDRVYHLACPASPIHYQRNPVRTIRTSVQGTLNMLDLARDVGARFLLASTSEVYGDPIEHPQKESYWGNVNPIGPRACYDEGKRCAEALSVSWARQYGTEVRVARIFNTYGPRMHSNDGRVVSNFAVQALKGLPLTVFGDGRQTRSFCYVTDLIDGLIRLMESDVDDAPVNLGNPFEVSMLDLANMICEAAGVEVHIEHRPLPQDDPVRRKPDISRARTLLGWEPRTTLEVGVSNVVRYFQAQGIGKGITNGRQRIGNRDEPATPTTQEETSEGSEKDSEHAYQYNSEKTAHQDTPAEAEHEL